jgi:hypothetical protein
VLQGVAQKLLKLSGNSPDYWPTVLKFIQFASAGLSPDVPPHVPPPGTRPGLTIKNSILPPGTVKWPPISHQVILLDGGEISDMQVDHSRIIFTEQPVKMTNVTFVDCVFEMPPTAAPNPYLQNASRQLLASDLNSAVIKGLWFPFNALFRHYQNFGSGLFWTDGCDGLLETDVKGVAAWLKRLPHFSISFPSAMTSKF